MKKIQIALKNEINYYPRIKIYEKNQLKSFNLVALFLLIVGLFVEYGYFSTIGHLGHQIAFEIFKIHLIKLLLILGFVAVLDSGLTLLSYHRPKNVKQLLCHPFERPALLFEMILILMLSLDAPVSAFCLASIVMTFMSQLLKRENTHFPLHPVLIGYIIGVVGTYWVNYNFGIHQTPPMFEAPFMSVANLPTSMTFEDFTLTYYSLNTVVVGLFEGSLAGTLILPLLISSLFLMKRRCLDFRSSGLYLVTYILISVSALALFQFESWMILLFLLNGSVLMSAVFLLPGTKSLPDSKMMLSVYIIGLSLTTFVFSYYIHFVFGPYLALVLFQFGLGVIRGIQVFTSNPNKTKAIISPQSHSVAM